MMRTSSAGRRFAMWVPLAAVPIVLLPALSAGQEPVKSFDQLSTRLKVGDTIYVTDAQGREIKGKIRSLDAVSVSLDGAAGRTFRAGDALTITKRGPDSLTNGMLIGGASGALLAAAGIAMCAANEECQNVGAGFAIFTAAGVGMGAAIDASYLRGKRIVYRAPAASGHARLSLAPVITPRAKGVAVSFSF